MNDNEYTVALLKMLAIVVITLTLSMGGFAVHKREVLARMVESGVDPQVAVCALGNLNGIEESAVCGVVAVRK